MLDKSLVDTIFGIAYEEPVSVGAGAGFSVLVILAFVVYKHIP